MIIATPAVLAVVQKDVMQPSLTSQQRVSNSNDIVATSTAPADYKVEIPAHLSRGQQTLKPVHDLSDLAVSVSNVAEDNFDTGLFLGRTFLNPTDAVGGKSSTTDSAHALESEVVSLKEQLLIQSKVCRWQRVIY